MADFKQQWGMGGDMYDVANPSNQAMGNAIQTPQAGVSYKKTPSLTMYNGDQSWSMNVSGDKDPEAAWESNSRGALRYGGLPPVATAYLEKAVGKDNFDKGFRVLDPLDITGELSKYLGEGIAGVLPKSLGGTGKYPYADVGLNYVFGKV